MADVHHNRTEHSPTRSASRSTTKVSHGGGGESQSEGGPLRARRASTLVEQLGRAGLRYLAVGSAGCLVVGMLLRNLPMFLVGAIGLLVALVRHWRLKRVAEDVESKIDFEHQRPAVAEADPDDMEGLVEQMAAQHRYALLVRAQIAPNLSEDQFNRTLELIDENMSLVPTGQVVIGEVNDSLDDGKLDVTAIQRADARLVQVEAVFLDRFAVTNEQFYEFVAAEGYGQIAIWDEEIWPAVLDFVDRTGHPGPRFWENGKYPAGRGKHPVVGVSWYEAQAYARWVGKRLPTDAEWVKAGCWPVTLKQDVWLQRKFPWGNTSDLSKTNIWGSGRGDTVPVDEYEDGASVGDVQQLIGNVWEWTSTNFGRSGDLSLTLPVPMRSLRGGAFDTYFENQATCHYQSGDNPLSRKHNIGFRLALGARDIAKEAVLGLRATTESADTDEVAEEVCV